MKLSELFPDMPKVVIGEVEYEVKFGTRAVLQVENDYPTPDEVKNVLQTLLTGVKASDLINLLFAGLLNTKAFKDKDSLIDAIEPKDFTTYADAILAAYTRSVVNQEQLDKLEVLSLNAKKKGGSRDFAGEYAFYRITCNMSKEEYMDATERELIALSIGNAEMNGAKTEYDDPGELLEL